VGRTTGCLVSHSATPTVMLARHMHMEHRSTSDSVTDPFVSPGYCLLMAIEAIQHGCTIDAGCACCACMRARTIFVTAPSARALSVQVQRSLYVAVVPHQSPIHPVEVHAVAETSSCVQHYQASVQLVLPVLNPCLTVEYYKISYY
jgi:hypothetical protein